MQLPGHITIRSEVPFAGEELARYLHMIPGCQPGNDGYPIYVRVTGTGGEDYTVSVSDKRADISGGSVRGAVYGTYAHMNNKNAAARNLHGVSGSFNSNVTVGAGENVDGYQVGIRNSF
mgnify:CR=1 FL=1